LYNGRYIHEDLIQETYINFLEVNPKVLSISTDAAYLKHIGKKVMLSLFQKRKQKLFNSNGQTSNIFEASNFDADFSFLVSEEGSKKDDDENKEKLISKISDVVYSELQNENKQMQVFIISQTHKLTDISVEFGVSRVTLNNYKKKAITLIKSKV